MKITKEYDFLLGAMSPIGFAGYFGQVLGNNYKKSILIKAAPGCGKSTLMKKIATHLLSTGHEVELIHCSSDPDSLDGVVCKDKGFSIVDATAPHALEPLYPVAGEEILSLYAMLDKTQLHQYRDEISKLFSACQTLQERACRYITAAGALITDSERFAASATDFSAAVDFAKALSAKNIPRASGPSAEEIRLVSATTCKGQIFYLDTIVKLSAKKLIILNDEYGAVSKCILKQIRDDALLKGHEIITCYCPMSPHEKIEHLFIPSLGLGFATENSFHEVASQNSRHIHCKRFMNEDILKLRRQRLHFNRKAATELLKEATELQKEAKISHDSLEQYYIKAADFAIANDECEKVIKELEY